MTATTEYVILVDENDQAIGLAEKLAAHNQALLHRAFSVFVFRNNPNTKKTELLLQQRAPHKYHSPLLWSNTCCSHPRQGETVIEAGERRLQEELGITATLKSLGWFHYHVKFDNGLSENEIDHVLAGYVDFDVQVHCDPAEIQSYRWVALDDLQEELKTEHEKFTPWFTEALGMIA